MGNCTLCRRKDASNAVKEKVDKPLKSLTKASPKDGAPPKAPRKDIRVLTSDLEESARATSRGDQEDPPVYHLALFTKVTKFKAWHRLFMQNGNNASLGKDSNIYVLPSARSSYCREKETKVFRDVHDEMKVLVLLTVLDMACFTTALGSPEMKRLKVDLEVSDELPIQLRTTLTFTEPNDSPAEAYSLWPAKERHDVLYVVQVEDFDWWYAGFVQHGNSKTGTWGFSVPFSRAELADETRTLVFRGINAPNRIAVALFDVDLSKFAPMLKEGSFVRLQGVLGEVGATRSVTTMKSGGSLVAPVDTDCNIFDIIGMPAWCKAE
jgi:hypothetical protein